MFYVYTAALWKLCPFTKYWQKHFATSWCCCMILKWNKRTQTSSLMPPLYDNWKCIAFLSLSFAPRYSQKQFLSTCQHKPNSTHVLHRPWLSRAQQFNKHNKNVGEDTKTSNKREKKGPPSHTRSPAYQPNTLASINGVRSSASSM